MAGVGRVMAGVGQVYSSFTVGAYYIWRDGAILMRVSDSLPSIEDGDLVLYTRRERVAGEPDRYNVIHSVFPAGQWHGLTLVSRM